MKHRSAIDGKAVSEWYAAKNKTTTVKESKAKDTARLDFVAQHWCSLYQDDKGWHIGGGRGKSLRKAIDGGIKAQKK